MADSAGAAKVAGGAVAAAGAVSDAGVLPVQAASNGTNRPIRTMAKDLFNICLT